MNPDEEMVAEFGLVELSAAMPADLLRELDSLEASLRSRPVAVGAPSTTEWTAVIGRLVQDGSPGFHQIEIAEDWSLVGWTAAERALVLERCSLARTLLQQVIAGWSPRKTLLLPADGVKRFHWLLGELRLHVAEVRILAVQHDEHAPERPPTNG